MEFQLAYPRRIAGLIAALAAAVALSFGLAAIVAEPASAQLPAICQQYPDLPQCQGPTDEGGGTTDDQGPTGTTTVSGPTADLGGGQGELPFTGYPLSALILLLLILLLIGLAIRAYLAVRERVGGDRTAGP